MKTVYNNDWYLLDKKLSFDTNNRIFVFAVFNDQRIVVLGNDIIIPMVSVILYNIIICRYVIVQHERAGEQLSYTYYIGTIILTILLLSFTSRHIASLYFLCFIRL